MTDVNETDVGEPIGFTRYLRPNGRRVEETIFRPSEITDLARAVAEKGGRFTTEVLMTGQVSFACEAHDPDLGETTDVAIEIVPNGPGVSEAVDRMIRSAHRFVVEGIREEGA